MNTIDQNSCEIVEAALATKTKELKMQVMYNGLTLIMGLVAGLLLAKFYRFVGFKWLN